MHVEVSVALNFVISYLYNKLPRRRVDMLADELEKGLKKKFEGHWYPDKPLKGTAFRCIRVNGEKIDAVIINAALACGIEIGEITGYLPDDLTLWIDPNEVSYRIGEKGVVKVLYSEKKPEVEGFDNSDREIQAATRGFNPNAQCFRPIDSLSSSLSHLSLSPSSPNPSHGWSSPAATINSVSPQLLLPPLQPQSQQTQPQTGSVFLPKSNSTPNFTAATFAQTKFGSTKLKSHAKRPSRLSPTEVSAYVKQRNHVPHPAAQQHPFAVMNQNRPRSLSPRDPRHAEFMAEQQYLFNQQQQALIHGDLTYSPVHHPPQFNIGFPENVMPGNATPQMLNGMNPALPSPPEGAKSFLDGLNIHNMSAYPSQFQHLLLAN
ncbi:protein Tob1-like [Tubulanus polymorphus]|uniref:protein Tob1-like n=1 Tax=Tubulanus polymorphus TaxID=672921 RepID=UPI003DA54A2A